MLEILAKAIYPFTETRIMIAPSILFSFVMNTHTQQMLCFLPLISLPNKNISMKIISLVKFYEDIKSYVSYGIVKDKHFSHILTIYWCIFSCTWDSFKKLGRCGILLLSSFENYAWYGEI